MAEYGINKVKFNNAHSHIVEVHAYKIENDATNGEYTFTRDSVISNIESNNKFITLLKKTDGNWDRGAEVKVIKIDNEKFIKTIANNTKKDNLDNLPEY